MLALVNKGNFIQSSSFNCLVSTDNRARKLARSNINKLQSKTHFLASVPRNKNKGTIYNYLGFETNSHDTFIEQLSCEQCQSMCLIRQLSENITYLLSISSGA